VIRCLVREFQMLDIRQLCALLAIEEKIERLL
jgi:hypothetical protein